MAESLPTLRTAPRPAHRAPLGPAGHLRLALVDPAHGKGQITRFAERAWASVTFEGARYTVDLAFEGDGPVEAGEAFIAALPDHEFSIPGQLVADATVIAVDHTLAPRPRLAVTCELLLLKDA